MAGVGAAASGGRAPRTARSAPMVRSTRCSCIVMDAAYCQRQRAPPRLIETILRYPSIERKPAPRVSSR